MLEEGGNGGLDQVVSSNTLWPLHYKENSFAWTCTFVGRSTRSIDVSLATEFSVLTNTKQSGNPSKLLRSISVAQYS